MEVIPSINCKDIQCVEERLSKSIKCGASWVQFDVADGSFAKTELWNKTDALKPLLIGKEFAKRLKVEAHLMVEHPERFFDEWVLLGVKRFLVHAEIFDDATKRYIEEFKKNHPDIEIGLAVLSSSSLDLVGPMFGEFGFVQVLSVQPGFHGQEFDERAIGVIKFIAHTHPNIVIEVDGGINNEVGVRVKEAGADVLVSDTFIFNSDNPKEAYEILRGL